MVCTQLSALLLLALATSAAAQEYDKYTFERVVVPINLSNNQVFNLRLPRLFPNDPNMTAFQFRRTFNDTCGLFDILYTAQGEMGKGPPPHVHYADDEWFFHAGSGQVRMFSGIDPPEPLIPGALPGYNVPAVEMGSVVLEKGGVLYSPKGSVHHYVQETDVTDFFAIHAPGLAMPIVVEYALDGSLDETERLALTGLYGCPHDSSGQMVGREDFIDARGEPVVGDPELERLQEMFDKAEECYSADVTAYGL